MIIFLDIDGVLNGHEKQVNSYSKMREDCVENFNHILKQVPTAKIVVSSSWRYLVYQNSMTLQGLENLFLSHGVDCHGRVIDITESDETTGDELLDCVYYHTGDCWFTWMKEHGVIIRSKQIQKYVETHQIKNYVVLDDFQLDVPNQVKTDSNVGLTKELAEKAIKILSETYAGENVSLPA